MNLRFLNFRCSVACAAFVAAVCLVAPTLASAAIEREILTNAEPTNLVNISPIRLENDVQPGVRTTERITIFNDSSSVVTVKAKVVDLGPPKDETILAEPVLDGYKFGAKDWVTSELDETTLQPFEKIRFDVVIDPPVDAPVGSSYAGVEFQFEGKGTADAGNGGKVALRFTTMLQVLLTVPGPVEHDLKLLRADARDMFHFGSTAFVTYGLLYENAGTVSEHVNGEIQITSLFGNKVKKIDLGERALIRGARGTDRAVWTDPPMFGIFTATATIRGDDGKESSKEIGRVVLLPPWWVIALVVASLVLPPVYLWWKRRQEWKLYLEDEEEELEDSDEYATY